jgi:hypothetical protein
MPKYRITYAFDCSCYGERTIEAESPEQARELAIELHKRDELMIMWDAQPDLGTDRWLKPVLIPIKSMPCLALSTMPPLD